MIYVFVFFISFFDEISLCKQNSPRLDAAFCFPMSHKNDQGLNELSLQLINIVTSVKLA